MICKMWTQAVGWSVAVVVCLVAGARPASAIIEFKKQFEARYAKKDGDETQKKLAAEVALVKCNVCHVGKSKKVHTRYGEALDKLLDKKADKKDIPKIIEALKTVEKEKSNPGDPNSRSFGDLLNEGKLPGDDCKPAPVDDSDEDS